MCIYTYEYVLFTYNIYYILCQLTDNNLSFNIFLLQLKDSQFTVYKLI